MTGINLDLPFERAEGETDDAWLACLIYCCLLTRDVRSLPLAQDVYYRNKKIPSRKNGNASRGWEDWCRKFKWTERAKNFDEKRVADFLEVEHAQMIKARDEFNKLGDIKYQAQIEIELLFSNWRNQSKEKGYFAVEYTTKAGDLIENDPGDIGNRLEQVAKIQKILNDCDRSLSDRRLTSVGIKSLIPD
jgi:hypothetical protein